jgi:serine phosphatase RsbU (regulator of sigma subunit)
MIARSMPLQKTDRSLGLSRSAAVAVWAIWATVVVGTVVVSLLAWTAFLSNGIESLQVGPLAVKPELSDQLTALFGSDELLLRGQLLVHIIGYAIYTGTGLFLVARRPATWLPLLGSGMLVLVGSSLFAPIGALTGTLGEVAVHVIGNLSPENMAGYWLSLTGVAVIAFSLVFPDAIGAPVWGRWIVASVAVAAVVNAASSTVTTASSIIPSGIATSWGLAVPVGVVATQMVRTTSLPPDVGRRARPVVLALAAVVGTFAMIWIARPSLTADELGLVLATPRLSAVYDVNLLLLLTAAVFAFPLSIWLAIARYRLFDIDLIVNRTLVYGTVTLIMVMLFGAVAAGVLIMVGGSLGSPMTGAEAGATGALTGAAVVIAFHPVRRRVQHVVDRRLFPSKYETDRAIERFAVRADAVVDIAALCAEVRLLLSDAFGADPVDLLLPDRSGALALPPGLDESLAGRRESLVLATSGDAEASPYVVAIPLVTHGRLVAAVLLGPRSGGFPYAALDLEALDRMAAVAAPAFRMAQLVQRQEEDALEHERVTQELGVAHRIQMELLPKELPRWDGWSLEAYYQPAREVGGDFYDFIALDDGRWVLIVGDVSGKGVPAAMVMATCRTLLRGASGERSNSPGAVLALVNDLLCPDIPESMFVTCMYGVLTPETGSFVFANAGHDLPFVRHAAGVDEISATGMPLGLMPGMEYEETSTTLAENDALLLSTDGLVEAHDPHGEMFGFPRVGEALAATSPHDSLIGSLLASQRRFTGPGWVQEDDITLLSFRRDQAPERPVS